jgi:hypothetical protein
MRLIAAGIFVLSIQLGAVMLLGSLGVFEHTPPVLIGLGIGALLILTCIVAVILFNPTGSNPFSTQSFEENIRQLESKGLLVSRDFQATRSFGVQEYEDEGQHYFIELTDGRVLFLSGQYLIDYEFIFEDEVNQPRMFPCSKFTVRRHRTEGYVIDIVCSGTVIEPELIAPPFSKADERSGQVPEDGQIISDMTYDAIKAARTSASI